MISRRFLAISSAACVNAADAKGNLWTLFKSRLNERQESCECGFPGFHVASASGLPNKLLPTRSWLAIFLFRANFPNC
jgi:hypothetical protein